MIAVIADDFTGAAEIAGLGLHHELMVELHTVVPGATDAGLLVIDTDTRSMNKVDALKVIEDVTKSVLKLQPHFIYKKTDSVLRGHVLPELNMMLKVLGLKKSLLIPANPSLNRTIIDGEYFYNGAPIHQSSFARDPEFAITSSDIKQMVNGDIILKQPKQALEDEGIFIGEVKDTGDLWQWAPKVDKNILPAGGGDFFSALLIATSVPLTEKDNMPGIAFGPGTLFICGTTFGKSVDSIKEISRYNGPVSYMPAGIVNDLVVDTEKIAAWADEIVTVTVNNAKSQSIIAIDGTTVAPGTTALSLRHKMAAAVNVVLKRERISELFIEGGSTAAAVIGQMGYTSFCPVNELSRGVVRMKVHGQHNLHLTVKPGSYDWPPGIWNFESSKN